MISLAPIFSASVIIIPRPKESVCSTSRSSGGIKPSPSAWADSMNALLSSSFHPMVASVGSPIAFGTVISTSTKRESAPKIASRDPSPPSASGT